MSLYNYKMAVRGQPTSPHNLQELEQSLVQEWRNIPQAFIQNDLFVNKTEASEQVIGAGGGHTLGISWTKVCPQMDQCIVSYI